MHRVQLERHDRAGWWGLLISSWLYASQFLWPHSAAQHVNAFVVAVLSTAVCAAAFGVPQLRYANALLGPWLLSSSWALPRLAEATLWNYVLVAAALLAVTTIPFWSRRSGGLTARRQHPRGRSVS